MAELRFKVTRISRATGYTGHYNYATLKQAEKEMYNYIHNDSYAVQIWDRKKQDFILWQMV